MATMVGHTGDYNLTIKAAGDSKKRDRANFRSMLESKGLTSVANYSQDHGQIRARYGRSRHGKPLDNTIQYGEIIGVYIYILLKVEKLQR